MFYINHPRAVTLSLIKVCEIWFSDQQKLLKPRKCFGAREVIQSLCAFGPRHYFVFPDVPSNPYSVRLSAVSQRLATVTFMKPDSHGGVPISYYLVQYKEVGSQEWRDVKSHSVQSEWCFLHWKMWYCVDCWLRHEHVIIAPSTKKPLEHKSISISVSWLRKVKSVRKLSHAHFMTEAISLSSVNILYCLGGIGNCTRWPVEKNAHFYFKYRPL